MAKLTHSQETVLESLQRSDKAWRLGKLSAFETAKREAAQAVQALLSQRDLDIRLALMAGIPKAQVGRRGLGTTSPAAISDSLARTEVFAKNIEARVTTRYQWVTTDENQPYLNGGMGMGKIERLHVTMSGPDYDTFIRESLEDKMVNPKRLDVWTDMTEHDFDVDEQGTIGYLGTPGKLFWNALISFMFTDGAEELAEWRENNPHTVYPGNFPQVQAEVAAPKERKTMSFSKVLEEGA